MVKQMIINHPQSLSSKAPITGKLNEPPLEISLIQQTSSIYSKNVFYLDEKSFTIANQVDFSKCNDWIPKVRK